MVELVSFYLSRLEYRHCGLTLDDIEIMIGSFGIKANASLLYKLQEDPLVYLVDVGPMDIVLSYKAMGYAVYGFIDPPRKPILVLPRVTIDAYWTNISLTKIE